jgi:hypothetical protein
VVIRGFSGWYYLTNLLPWIHPSQNSNLEMDPFNLVTWWGEGCAACADNSDVTVCRSLTSQAGSRKQMQLDQSKAWWEEQAANKAAVQAAQKEAEQAYAELTRYQVCVCVCECVCACVCVCVCCI